MGPNEITKQVSMLAARIRNMPALQEIAKQRAKLPITSFKDEITLLVSNHQVVLVAGETGCGKTTQVPQFILDHMWSKGKACKIICTQPRRISAISVAERIATERGEPIGETVGYQIRLESKGGPHSSLMFCTNGVLLRKLVMARYHSKRSERQGSSENLEDELTGLDATHVIVDEIHERDCNADFLLVILKDLLNTSPDLRVVLMSATLDAERFSAYFNGCPVLRVPGFTYPVHVHYLEDVLALTEFRKNNNDGVLHDARRGESCLNKEDADAMDEALSFAWLNNEFELLMDMITESPDAGLNYQHSLTGATALMIAAGKGRVDDVSTILSLGANSSIVAKDGSTALDWALKYKQEKIAELIQCYEKQIRKSQSSEETELLDMYHKQSDQEEVDMSLIESLLVKICTTSDRSEQENGAILIFFPGWEDIMQCRERLLASSLFSNSSKFLLLPLHSMVPSAEQKKVFKRPPSGVRKVILATNIAETAITIDDVVCVIDSGRIKEKSYDPYTNVSTLQTSWVSKASAKQREGRAGRCLPGVCYHLFSKVREAALPEYQLPEMKRTPLEELCLKVKLLQPDGRIKDFLSKAVDPPLDLSIKNAVTLLQDIGALTEDEKVTKLGEQLGSLPVHPATSKMLLLAILLNCLDPALTIACAAGYREPFVLPTDPRQKKDAFSARQKLAEAYGGYSDHLAVVAAFDGWEAAKSRGQENRFCSQHFISPGIMVMLDGMRRQLQNELAQRGFVPKGQHPCSRNARDPGIVRAIVAAGMYPMVGRLLPPLPNGQKAVVQTARGEKVRIHQHSANFRLVHYDSKFGSSEQRLLVFDEITRGDSRVYIRNCTLLNPHPLLVLSTELVVAPLDPDSDDDELVDDDEMTDSEEEEINPTHKKRNNIMAAPEKRIAIILDRWLKYQATSVEAAQLYCLRERLLAALAFKITKPRSNLPAMLAAAVYTLACLLSFEGVLDPNSSSSPVLTTSKKLNSQQDQRSWFQELNTQRGSPDIPPSVNRTMSNGRGQSQSLISKQYVAVRDGRFTAQEQGRSELSETGRSSRGSRSSKRPRGR
ncbi:hypothetical protein O6H91_22G036900 [Diphasiastrum complanatum]|nr:hypothetical protein O6H91_22G036900 [Diphasiastrum complanatum]